MKIERPAKALFISLVLPLLMHVPAQAQNIRRPAYLHAVTELRDARWLLEHRAGGFLDERERRTLGDIDRALEDVERSAGVDVRFLYEHPRDDAYPGFDRLRRVSELLRSARLDIGQQEDIVPARDAQDRALVHIDNAIRMTEEIMVDRERLRDRDHDRDRDRDYDRR